LSIEVLERSFSIGITPDDFGITSGVPMLIVEVTTEALPDNVFDSIRRLPAVIIGVARSIRSLVGVPDESLQIYDVLLTESDLPSAPWVQCENIDATLDSLVASIDSSSGAAVALVQLLRYSSELELVDAIIAESFAYSMLQSGFRHQVWLRDKPTKPVKAFEESAVLIEREDGVLRIILNRPEVHNAFGAQMRHDLVSALELAKVDDSISEVLFFGKGASFCSGGDLDEFGYLDNPVTAHFIRTSSNAAVGMAAIAHKTRVFVHGACIGAGIELASFCAHITADAGAFFKLPEVSMGLIPGSGGTVSVRRRIGRQRTAFMSISGEPVGADLAMRWGLIDEISDFSANRLSEHKSVVES
jgi:enoyl-CoA hydratase/carnithine racemase